MSANTSQKPECPAPQAQELLTRGGRCGIPPFDSMPDSRVYPLFYCRGSDGPAHPAKGDQREPVIDSGLPSSRTERVHVKRWKGNPRTNVTTMKSRGLCFEEACLSAAHVNAARATGSTVSVDCPLPCMKKSTTTGSEVSLLRRSDRE